jgi:hypothetical protein
MARKSDDDTSLHCLADQLDQVEEFPGVAAANVQERLTLLDFDRT